MIVKKKLKILTRKKGTSILELDAVYCGKCKSIMVTVYKPVFFEIKCPSCGALWEYRKCDN